MTIPIIDIATFDHGTAAERRQIADQWAGAFETLGFCTVVGHGIPEPLSASLYHTALRFFDLPHAAKMRCAYPGQQTSQGYVPPDMETVAATYGQDTPSDLCQSFSVNQIDWDLEPPTDPALLALHRPNLWPEELPDLRALVIDYFRAARAAARRIVRISAMALGEDEHWFDPFYTHMGTTLRLVDYPEQIEPPLPGQLRYGPHTDYGGFTLLLQDAAPGGLQVLMPDGAWQDVTPYPGGLVVNTGDLMSRWTNGRFRSNVHRVINPPRERAGSSRRLSIVFFSGPNRDAEIACIPSCRDARGGETYPPVVFHEFLAAKFRQNMQKPLEV